jgi:glutamate-5-semialdehyde dehydrogenase
MQSPSPKLASPPLDPHLSIPAAEPRNLEAYCAELGQHARTAARELALASGALKNGWLHFMAEAIENRTAEILEANSRDLASATELGLGGAALDRLRLTPDRLRGVVAGVRDVAALPDPVGRVLEGSVRPNGLQVLKVGVPLGVILFIYESRPNVTVDAAALCVKSGNALILRGGKEAFHSNTALHRILQDSLRAAGLPSDAVQLVATTERAAVGHLLQLRQWIDLVIPRGGESLIRRVAEEARMPVLKHYMGNCHVYVDRSADLEMAERIVLNAKCQRPGVCNAAESLLVHVDVAAPFLARAGRALRQRGVQIRGCSASCQLIPDAIPATEADYAAEYLDLILSVKVVAGLEEAIAHINQFGSQHTDAIVTNDLAAARQFTTGVDSSAVLVNASTRFNDGYELGLGAEIGISTEKFHARGPCGLVELTSYKYVVYGDGHVRGS